LLSEKREKVISLEIAVDAARNRTTLGEISDALETVLEDTKHKLNLVACIVEIKTISF
jgi:hypothetical protein